MSEAPKPGEKIWDWELIRALYFGGLSHSEIIRIPKFKDLSLKYLQNKASRERWRELRESAQAEGTGEIARPLIAKMQEAEGIHQEWLLDKLAKEREAFDKETAMHLKGGKNQLERLKIIDALDSTVRRQLGLDDRKPLNDTQKNLGLLIHFQVNPPKAKGLPGTMTISVASQLAEAGVMDPAKVEAAKLIEAYKEEIAEVPEKPLPPGIRMPTPFKVKGEPEPQEGVLVNEKGQTSFEEAMDRQPDLVEVLREGGYDAHVISEGRAE